ncbi:hypothetical protein [Nonomuraea sp. NPDC003214]
MRFLAWRKRHPVIKTSFALTVSRWKLHRIVFLYAAVTIGIGAATGLALHLARAEDRSISYSLREGFGAILNPGDILKAEDSLLFAVIGLLTSMLGVIFPVLLLGAFVFKLFHQDPIVWREALSIEDHLDGFPVLIARFYNGTTSPLVNITIQVFARIQSTGTPRFITNFPQKVAQGERGALKGISVLGIRTERRALQCIHST